MIFLLPRHQGQSIQAEWGWQRFSRTFTQTRSTSKIPATMAATNNSTMGWPLEMRLKPGPGQIPARPQPMPNRAEPR